ncbi:polysulfide reductase NrfD [Propioniciclava coleopterorum]|uniref:Polysulfide reductase NrfD n=2 Tax=Propioniciclava coleopterorum TaxID=2714937 RepID=A0A6G7Y891_9ACTN|nr:polysulfide reductase NrfD [Propioniciclava coleopterorum]
MSTTTKTPDAPAASPARRWWSHVPHEPFLTPRNRRLWYGFLGLVLLAGSWFVVARLTQGVQVTDLTSQMPWGAWVAFYIYFVGLSAGAFLLSSLIYVFGMHQFERIGRAALLSAIVCMGVALAFIGLDLGRFDRALSTLIHFHWTSPLSWEVRFYTMYVALLAVELVFAIMVQRRTTDPIRAHRWMRILGIIGVPLAIFGVHGGTGTIFAVVKARGMWFGGLFPIVFVVSAIVSGTALVMAIYFWQRRGAGKRPSLKLMQQLSVVLVGAIFIDLGLMFYEFIVPILAFEHHDKSIMGIMAFGPYWWSFWFFQIGMLVAALIICMSPLKKRVGWLAAAAMMVIVGILGVRFNIVVPPLVPPVIDGYPTNIYFPTINEWMVAAFLCAGGALAYSLICEWQPIFDPDPDDTEAIAAEQQQEVPA